MKNLISMPNDATPSDVVKQLVASANTREEITLSMKRDTHDSFIRDLNAQLLKFGEPALLDCLTCTKGYGVLFITLKSWEGPLLFEDDYIFYLRSDTHVSSLHLEKEKDLNRCFTPIIVPRL